MCIWNPGIFSYSFSVSALLCLPFWPFLFSKQKLVHKFLIMFLWLLLDFIPFILQAWHQNHVQNQRVGAISVFNWLSTSSGQAVLLIILEYCNLITIVNMLPLILVSFSTRKFWKGPSLMSWNFQLLERLRITFSPRFEFLKSWCCKNTTHNS